MDDGKIVIKAEIDSSGLDSDLAKVEKKVTKSASNLSDIVKGISFQRLLEKATQSAINFAKNVNEATEKVSAKLKAASTLYGDVAVDQERLLKNLSEISADTGASLETLGQSVYDALSAGVKPSENMADVLKVVESSAKLAKGGFTDTATALSSTMKVINAYSMDLKELDKVQGILVQTQNSGITTVDELGASLAQVVPTAASFGVSFENVGAAIAEMTKQGTKTAQATTSLNAIIAELGKNGTKASKGLEDAAKNAGLAETDFKSMLDSGMSLSDILQLMADYAEDNGLSMVDMFSSIEAGKGSLQLTGKAGEDFNQILGSMGQSAGLVQEAFEKTVDPSERLSASFTNLMVALGTKFKPAADSVRTSLADMFTSMTRNVSAGSDMERKFNDLKVALGDYKTLQEESAGKTDALTTAMKLQAKAKLEEALIGVSKSYAESSKSVDDYTDGITKAEKKQTELEASLKEIAEGTGKTVEQLRALMVEDEDSFLNSFSMQPAALASFLSKEKELAKTEDELIDLRAKSLRAEVDKTQFIDLLTQGYIEEDEAAQVLLQRYPQLKQAVLDNVEAYKAEAEAKAKAAEAGKTDSDETDDEEAYALTEKEELHNQLVEAIANTNKEYENLRKASEETGVELYKESEHVGALKDIYVDFLKKGVSPTSSAMVSLAEDIKKLTPAEEQEATMIEMLQSETDSLVDNIFSLISASDDLGAELISNDDAVKQLTSLYQKYVELGVDPASDAMKDLVGWINAFSHSADDAGGKANKLADNYKEVGEVFKGVMSGVEDWTLSLVTTGDRLKEINDEIENLTKANGDLEQATKNAEAAQAEYNLAKERGDTVAIKNAESKLAKEKQTLDAVNKKIKALEEERKSVGILGDAWKAWGKSALESLVAVLEGIGAELAAKAALAAVEMNWAGFGAATAGSAAAYLAAGLLKGASQKFANGGIVQGNSYTGDNIPVRVNAGELILNTAQQDTIARILEASVALAELSASGGVGGRGITINMEGSTIYGLDEPAVGRAIYENIENLKYEGVI